MDGVINENEWSEASKFEGLFDVSTGKASPEQGQFWLGYDSKYIYFAAKLSDSQPKSIKATEYRTNVELPGDDTVGLIIDLSGSLSDFSTFTTNPRGATNIALTGGRAVKREWTGEFIAQSHITPTGWETEMRIPWSILPVPAGGKRNVRFNVSRFLARLNREYAHVYTDSGKAADTPTWQDVELPKPSVDRSIKLLPYTYAGYDRDNGGVFNSGLDLKTSLSDQIQLVGTVNPDFRNIENAILSLDFSRFARIADESRPFFQEGAEYFDSGIYLSQVIRKFDVGVNSYGKISDKLQFGVLDTVDFGHSNNSVANLTYAPTANDNYRATVTQSSFGNHDNNAYMLRYYRQLGPWSLFGRTMQSDDSLVGHGGHESFELGYSGSGLFGFTQYSYVEPNFSPGLGFFPEKDYKGLRSFVNYSRPIAKGPLQDYGATFEYLDYSRISGQRYRSDINGSGGFTTRGGTNVQFAMDRPVFEGSHDRIDGVYVRYPVNDPYHNVSTGYTYGEIGGMSYRLETLETAYRPISKLQLSLSYQKFHLGPTDEDQTILGGNLDLGSDRSVSGRLVESHGDTNFYLAYRRSGNKGAEYYLILGDPNAPRFRSSLILKMVVPFKV